MTSMCVRLVLLLLLAATGSTQQRVKCPRECSCNGHTVVCASRSLTRIPDNLPSSVQRLDLQGNHIAAVRKSDLDGLHQLRVLQLQNNAIATIEPGAFAQLTQLQRLRLNHNRLSWLPDALFRHNRLLHRIDLSDNLLTVLTADIMRGPQMLNNLQLDANQLVCVDAAVLNHTNLEILSLSNNNLTSLPRHIFEHLPNLRTLRLHDNPWQCDCYALHLAQYLQRQPQFARHVRCAAPRHLQGQLLELPSLPALLRCSGLEVQQDTSCAQRPVCPVGCTCVAQTVDCRNRGLTTVPANLPPNTTELRLEQNEIRVVPPRAFDYLKVLRRLDLSNNKIEELSPRSFEGLQSLTSLVLYGNMLVELPSQAFKGLHKLQLLLLNANRLQCVRYDTFDDLHNLNLLSLYDNNIRSLGNGTLSPLRSLQTLHLARNPLICDCNMQWLAVYLQDKPVETSGARCEAPARVHNRRVAQLHATKYRCKGAEEEVTRGAGACLIDHPCPEACECDGSFFGERYHCVMGTSISCAGLGLSTVPQPVPRFVTRLSLADNQLTADQLHRVFDQLINLRHLDLSGNLLTAFDKPLLPKENNLETLDLSRNQLEEVGVNALENLWALRNLSLSSNRIRCIAPGTFDKLTSLRQLYLEQNAFVCSCQMDWFVNYLHSQQHIVAGQPECAQPASLRHTLIKDVQLSTLQCQSDLPMSSTCVSGVYCPVGCVCERTTVRCSHHALSQFPLGVPLDTTELYLDNNDIEYIPDEINKLTQLTKLDLSNNRIHVLQDGAFRNLSALSTLIVSFNKLQCIRPLAFEGLNSLRILSLHANDLSQMPATAFAGIRATLTHIAVGSNPLYCDCSLGWLSEWIKYDYVEPGIARCDGPEPLKQQLVLTADTDAFICDENSTLPLYIRSKCDACAKQPCENKGTCVTSSSSSAERYTCQCHPGYHGQHCEHVIDACYGQPCLNNATCKADKQQGRFSCICPKGFAGIRCETNIDDCEGNQCKNGATCVDGINDYSCSCTRGYTGWDCGKTIDYCAADVSACKNGAVCVPEDKDYRCVCALGFVGRNCSQNVDDCAEHKCLNGAQCVDGINSYTCRCVDGYNGRFCEIPPVSNALYPRTSACHESSCNHGECISSSSASNSSAEQSEQQCRCHAGWTGEACDALNSVTVAAATNNSFIRLGAWSVGSNTANATLTIVTTAESGVLLYYGNADAFVSMELFEGHVKVAYDVGNHPASLLYSFIKVNDGRAHRIELLCEGQRVTLLVDEQQPRTVLNRGPQLQFRLKNKELLYLAGLPADKAKLATQQFHLRNASSLDGCLVDVYVNKQPVDLSESLQQPGISAGCGARQAADACAEHRCVHGQCRPEPASALGYTCHCDRQQNYVGAFCEKREHRCVKKRSKQLHRTADGCRSRRPIKNAVCQGWCGNHCCAPVRTKQRKVEMVCAGGARRSELVTIVRKCDCQPTCTRPVPFNAWRWRT